MQRTLGARTRFFADLALVPLLLLAAESFAAPIVVPTTLLPGQQYRLAFVTAGTRDATSLSIADYHAFVTAEANTEAALSSISWQVIGSTAAVSARDHTGTSSRRLLNQSTHSSVANPPVEFETRYYADKTSPTREVGLN